MTIPAGVVIAVPTSETHRDEITYSNPDEFDGFRSVKLRENGGDETTGKYQAISSSNEHIPFGLGRHIW
jgi:cytochrome P450